MKEEFFTFREYMKSLDNELTACGEDYLEMIYRLSKEKGYTRINDLASALNVQPPSVTKMVKKLSDMGLIIYERYGWIYLNEKGKNLGNFLLARHKVVEKFLELLGIGEGFLEETEKIEHTINGETLSGIKDLIDFFYSNPHVMEEFIEFRSLPK